MYKQIWKWKIPLVLCFFGIFLEVVVFNYRHWESMLWREEHVLMQEWVIGSGLREEEPLTYRFVENEGEETATIEFLNIQKELHNIHVSLEILEPETAENEAVNIQLKVTDAANAKYFRLPERDILTSAPKSEYIRLHLSGDTEEVLLIINAQPGDLIRIHDVSANVRVPMFLSLGRMLTVIFLLLAGYFLRPSSGLHKLRWTESGWKGRFCVAVLLCMEFLAAGVVLKSNLSVLKNNEELIHTQQYQMLAHSLAEGKTWLDVEPDEVLMSLSNPYDYRLRSMTMETEGGEYLWDAAYYEGRYYVYFGIVPELLFFLPYYLITGKDLAVMPVIGIEGCLLLWGLFALLDVIVRRWFPKTSLPIYLLTALLAANGCGVWSFFRNPTFYEVPILAGLAFGVWGLYFWLRAVQKERLNRLQMALGSLFLALTAGCRPQLVLVLLLAFPIFGAWFLRRSPRKTEKLADAACFGGPILAAAIGLMYYNYIRFGSVTDFGAGYNLTLQDMTHRKMDMGRTAFGFFTVFFQPPNMTGVFPYFEQVKTESQYYGQVIRESGFGGLLATNLILFLSLLPFRFRKIMEHREAAAAACLFTGIAVAIAFFDIQIGGLIPRYTVDVAWLLFLSTAIVLLAVMQTSRGSAFWKPCYLVFAAGTVQSLLFQFLTVFTDVYDKVKDVNPHWFYQMEHLIEFWL